MNLGACAALTISPLTGVWYRARPLQHLNTALETSQTRFIPGRFNDGNGLFDVLYLCENPFVAFMEVGATFGSLTNVVPNPAVPWAFLNVRVTLHAISDLAANVASLQTAAQELTGDWREYTGRKSGGSMVGIEVGAPPTHQLGNVLHSVPALEGFLTFSAKVPTYRCLVVFPNKLHSASVVEFFDPAGNVAHTCPDICTLGGLCPAMGYGPPDNSYLLSSRASCRVERPPPSDAIARRARAGLPERSERARCSDGTLFIYPRHDRQADCG